MKCYWSLCGFVLLKICLFSCVILKFENPSIFNLYLFFFMIYILYKYRKTHTQYFFVSNISFFHFSVIIIILIKRVVFPFFFSFFKYVFALRPNHDSPYFFPFIILLFQISVFFSTLQESSPVSADSRDDPNIRTPRGGVHPN